MGRNGVCWDNAVTESQWFVLKSELYDRYQWDTPAQAITAVEAWIYGFYNTKRLNSAIGYQTQSNSKHVNTHKLSQKRRKGNKSTVRDLRATQSPVNLHESNWRFGCSSGTNSV